MTITLTEELSDNKYIEIWHGSDDNLYIENMSGEIVLSPEEIPAFLKMIEKLSKTLVLK